MDEPQLRLALLIGGPAHGARVLLRYPNLTMATHFNNRLPRQERAKRLCWWACTYQATTIVRDGYIVYRFTGGYYDCRGDGYV